MMNRKLGYILLLGMSFLLNACGTVQFAVPLGRLESPETGWDAPWHFQFDTGISSRDVITVGQVNVVPPNLSNPTHSPKGNWYMKAAITTSNWLTIGLKSSIFSAPSDPELLYAKAQFIGETANKSKKGDISMAGTLGYGRKSYTGSGTGGFSTNSYPWQFSLVENIIDSSLIGGYRINDYILGFGSVFLSKLIVRGEGVQGSSTDGSVTGGTYPVPSDGQVIGATVNTQLALSQSKNVALTGELGWANVVYGNSSGTFLFGGIIIQITTQ